MSSETELSTRNDKVLFIIVDNRIIPQTDYHREGLAASFQHYVCELIAKYFMLSRHHQWFPSTTHIIGAGSPSTATKLGISVHDDAKTIQTVLEPRFSILGGNLMTKTTWSTFLVSAVSTAAKLVPSENSQSSRNIIVIYTTDLVLFGDDQSQSTIIADGIRSFLQVCAELQGSLPNFEIRILSACVNNMQNQTHQSIDTTKEELFYREVSSKGLSVRLESIYVSSLQFDYELRTLTSEILPDPITTLNLNPTAEPCNLFVALSPHTFNAADCILHMPEMEYCGVCHRHNINPLFLAGYAMEVRTPTKQQVRGRFGDQQFLYNRTLVQSLKMWLAKLDLLLIVKVPYIPQGQSRTCSKYWALIPPAIEEGVNFMQQNMALILLHDRDQLIAPSKTLDTRNIHHQQHDLIVDELYDQFQQLLPSLIAIPNNNEAYNPWTYIGGSLNAQFDVYRRQNMHHTFSLPANVAANSSMVPTAKGTRPTSSINNQAETTTRQQSSTPSKQSRTINNQNSFTSTAVVHQAATGYTPLIPPPSRSHSNISTANYSANNSNTNTAYITPPMPGRGRPRASHTAQQPQLQPPPTGGGRGRGNTRSTAQTVTTRTTTNNTNTNTATTASKPPTDASTITSNIQPIAVFTNMNEKASTSSNNQSDPQQPSKRNLTKLLSLDNDSEDDDENLFNNMRPRFLKRKYSSTFNKGKTTSTTNHTTNTNSEGKTTAIETDTITDIVEKEKKMAANSTTIVIDNSSDGEFA